MHKSVIISIVYPPTTPAFSHPSFPEGGEWEYYRLGGKHPKEVGICIRDRIGGVSPKIRFAFPPQNIQFAGFTHCLLYTSMGQFRDKSSHVIMAEYRQMINTDKSTWVKRMLNHVGYVCLLYPSRCV